MPVHMRWWRRRCGSGADCPQAHCCTACRWMQLCRCSKRYDCASPCGARTTLSDDLRHTSKGLAHKGHPTHRAAHSMSPKRSGDTGSGRIPCPPSFCPQISPVYKHRSPGQCQVQRLGSLRLPETGFRRRSARWRARNALGTTISCTWSIQWRAACCGETSYLAAKRFSVKIERSKQRKCCRKHCRCFCS
jgi:hypothetical protein